MSNNVNNTTVSGAITASDIDLYLKRTPNKLIHCDLEWDRAIGDYKILFTKIEDTAEFLIRPTEFHNFTKTMTNTSNSNIIEDTDKVYFSGTSKFPRNNFNKYSPGAKRVQNIAKADKIVVVDENMSIEFGQEYFYDKINDIFYRFDTRQAVNDLYNEKREGGRKEARVGAYLKKIDPSGKLHTIMYNGGSYWVDTNALSREFRKHLHMVSQKFVNFEIGWYNVSTRYAQAGQKDYLDLLLAKYPFEMLINDNSANKYLDAGKPTLTAEQMENIMPLLSGDKANVGIALKLLENMNLRDAHEEFVGMMTVVFMDNERRIKKTPAWNYTGIKNLRKEFNLSSLDGICEMDGFCQLRKIGGLYDSLPQNKKEKFKEVTGTTIVKILTERVGAGVINLLNK